MRQSKRHLRFNLPRVVAVVDTPVAMNRARALQQGEVDAIEIRSDCFLQLPSAAELAAIKFPLIATARHPEEGGARKLPDTRRRDILLELLDNVDLVDIELRSLKSLKDVIGEACKKRVRVVLSHHDFSGTPSVAELRKIIQRSETAGASVIKIATVTRTVSDVARLLAVFEKPPRTPLAVMGMGRLGMASRLLFARCGSVLNYGWLDRPVVAGQWSAIEFKNLLRKIPHLS